MLWGLQDNICKHAPFQHLGGRNTILLVSFLVITQKLFSVKITDSTKKRKVCGFHCISTRLYRIDFIECVSKCDTEDSHFGENVLSHLRKQEQKHTHTHTSLKLTNKTIHRVHSSQLAQAVMWNACRSLTGVLAAGPSLLSAPAGCPPLRRPPRPAGIPSDTAEEGPKGLWGGSLCGWNSDLVVHERDLPQLKYKISTWWTWGET